MTTIADLKSRIDGVEERQIETTLGSITVNDDASVLTVNRDDVNSRPEQFQLDEKVERSFGKYLGVPKPYLEKCTPDLKAYNLNYWLKEHSNKSAVIEVAGDRFVNVHKQGLVIIPLRSVVDVISDTLDPTYEIVELIRNDTKFQIDVTTPHHVEVEPWREIEDRNPEHHATEGDITHGGIRFRANPTEVEEPLISTFLYRLWCSNGATSPEAESKIKLKGNTVDDVLIDMRGALLRVVSQLDDKLAQYAALATKYPPGSKDAFARQLGQEFKVPARVLNKILDRIALLPDGASLYDILQVFTSFANEEGVAYNTILKLQEIGGTLAFDTEAVTHRCGACERLLP